MFEFLLRATLFYFIFKYCWLSYLGIHSDCSLSIWTSPAKFKSNPRNQRNRFCCKAYFQTWLRFGCVFLIKLIYVNHNIMKLRSIFLQAFFDSANTSIFCECVAVRGFSFIFFYFHSCWKFPRFHHVHFSVKAGICSLLLLRFQFFDGVFLPLGLFWVASVSSNYLFICSIST